jgi:histidinol phosphatase-like PHP family hydrolase
MVVRTLMCLVCLAMAGAAWSEAQWYKGATHLHSLWSDGNAAPEYVIKWYADHGWDFVCPSDHNTLLEGEKYFEITEGPKLTQARVDELRTLFGEDWVVLKDGKMRLKTLEELRAHFEKPGKFILLSAEEMTTKGGNPHINALNVREVVPGQPNEGPKSSLIQYYVDAIAAQSKKFRVPMIAHLNHVNFSDRITTEEIIGARGLTFFEVYNGHDAVHSWGIPAEGVPSNERHWDVVNSMKQLREPGYLMYGVATDDSHNYFDFRVGTSNPGRGWIMVRARSLKAKALMNAMRKGDFYASTGVVLTDIRHGRKSLGVTIAGEDGVSYTTQYVGTRKGFNQETKPALDVEGKPLPRSSLIYSDQIGEVLYETKDLESSYSFKGDEMYVRARIVSDRLQPNPHEDGDYEMAWVQPVLVK